MRATGKLPRSMQASCVALEMQSRSEAGTWCSSCTMAQAKRKVTGTEIVCVFICWWAQVFASLYSLSQNRKGDDIRWTVLRVVLEFLQVKQCQQAVVSSAASSNDMVATIA